MNGLRKKEYPFQTPKLYIIRENHMVYGCNIVCFRCDIMKYTKKAVRELSRTAEKVILYY